MIIPKYKIGDEVEVQDINGKWLQTTIIGHLTKTDINCDYTESWYSLEIGLNWPTRNLPGKDIPGGMRTAHNSNITWESNLRTIPKEEPEPEGISIDKLSFNTDEE